VIAGASRATYLEDPEPVVDAAAAAVRASPTVALAPHDLRISWGTAVSGLAVFKIYAIFNLK
jgi:hypothetical protein